MPKNMTGGKHKGRKNGEGSTGKKNRTMVEDFIDDLRTEGKVEGVHVGRVLRRCGDGRMEVFYVDGLKPMTVNSPIKGSLSGRGKSQAFIEVGSIVLVASTGLSGSISHEIIAVMTGEQVDMIRKEVELDMRILARETDSAALIQNKLEEEGFEFDYSESAAAQAEVPDVDIDTI
jgi:hypothetical protein